MDNPISPEEEARIEARREEAEREQMRLNIKCDRLVIGVLCAAVIVLGVCLSVYSSKFDELKRQQDETENLREFIREAGLSAPVWNWKLSERIGRAIMIPIDNPCETGVRKFIRDMRSVAKDTPE